MFSLNAIEIAFSVIMDALSVWKWQNVMSGEIAWEHHCTSHAPPTGVSWIT